MNGDVWKYFLMKNDKGKDIHHMDGCPVVENASDFDAMKNYNDPVAFVGMVLPESKMFYYKDKKSGEKVGAFRLILENDKQIVETILWPSTFDGLSKKKKNDFEDGALIVIFGELGYSSYKRATELRFLTHKRIM